VYAKITVVEVHAGGLFAPTGPIGRWATSVSREMKSKTQAAVPISKRPNKSRANAHEPTGSLKKGIRSSASRVGPLQFQIEMESTASYSLYVIKGTGMIFSKSARIPKGEPGAGQFAALEGGGMYLPSQPWAKSRFRQRVRGQQANNFRAAGVRATAANHSALAGFR
jgi:hypothetical protein